MSDESFQWLSYGGLVRVLAVGSDANGAEIRLQLSVFLRPDAKLDEPGCAESPGRCRLSMMRNSKEVWAGTLVRSAEEWVVHRGAGDDDPVWRIEVNCIRPGNHIVIRQPGQVLHFTIAEVSNPSSSRHRQPR